jgi:hypothetical protein
MQASENAPANRMVPFCNKSTQSFIGVQCVGLLIWSDYAELYAL